jgi:hypothetical protein
MRFDPPGEKNGLLSQFTPEGNNLLGLSVMVESTLPSSLKKKA